MKKAFAYILSLAIFLSMCPFASADNSQAVTIKIGEVYTDSSGGSLGAAFADSHSRTMVPLRALANKLGLAVSWDNTQKAASFTDNVTTVVFTLNKAIYTVNGVSATMNTTVTSKGGRVYAPARYLAEAFGYDVSWDNTTKTVYIQHNSEPMTVNINSGNVKPTDITYVSYRYKSSSYNYDVLVITNRSSYDCELDISASYYGADGKLLDVGSREIIAMAANSSVSVYLMPDYDYAKAGYKFTVSSVSKIYRTCTQNLKVDYNTTDSSVVGTVTNNGTFDANFVLVTTLFFKDGKIVYTDESYADVSASSTSIPAGGVGSFKCSCYDAFDSVQVYVDAEAYS
jgi:hypothetical protein